MKFTQSLESSCPHFRLKLWPVAPCIPGVIRESKGPSFLLWSWVMMEFIASMQTTCVYATCEEPLREMDDYF